MACFVAILLSPSNPGVAFVSENFVIAAGISRNLVSSWGGGLVMVVRGARLTLSPLLLDKAIADREQFEFAALGMVVGVQSLQMAGACCVEVR